MISPACGHGLPGPPAHSTWGTLFEPPPPFPSWRGLRVSAHTVAWSAPRVGGVDRGGGELIRLTLVSSLRLPASTLLTCRSVAARSIVVRGREGWSRSIAVVMCRVRVDGPLLRIVVAVGGGGFVRWSFRRGSCVSRRLWLPTWRLASASSGECVVRGSLFARASLTASVRIVLGCARGDGVLSLCRFLPRVLSDAARPWCARCAACPLRGPISMLAVLMVSFVTAVLVSVWFSLWPRRSCADAAELPLSRCRRASCELHSRAGFDA